jgi:hypothetical protein
MLLHELFSMVANNGSTAMAGCDVSLPVSLVAYNLSTLSSLPSLALSSYYQARGKKSIESGVREEKSPHRPMNVNHTVSHRLASFTIVIHRDKCSRLGDEEGLGHIPPNQLHNSRV